MNETRKRLGLSFNGSKLRSVHTTVSKIGDQKASRNLTPSIKEGLVFKTVMGPQTAIEL